MEGMDPSCGNGRDASRQVDDSRFVLLSEQGLGMGLTKEHCARFSFG